MLFERQAGVGRFVFGANCQEDAPLFELFEPELEAGEGFANALAAEADTRQAIITDGAAPKQSVEVEDQALLELPEAGRQLPGEGLGQHRFEVGGIRQAGIGIEAGSPQLVQADQGSQGRLVEEGQVGLALG